MTPLHPSRLPAVRLALLLGLATLTGSAQSGPVLGNPPNEPPATPSPPLPSRPSEDFKDHSPSAPAQPSAASEHVLVEVARLSAETTRLSQIATDRAAYAEVRDFAAEVTHASQALTAEIDRLAAARNVAVHPDTAAEDEEWQKKNPNRFDEAYLQRARLLHEGAIAALEDYASGKDADPEIAAAAKRHLPGLHERLRQAESLDELVSHSPASRREESIARAWPGHGRPGSPPVILALRDENVD